MATTESHTQDQPSLIQIRLENLISFVCKGVLILIPVLFAVGHIAADGEPWDYATGETFSPMFNLVSSYAWRSPAGWAIVSCMVGIGYVMGFVSWHAMKRGRGFLAWFTAVVSALAMVKMLEAARYPFKPSRSSYSRILREIGGEPTHAMKREMWSGGLYAMGVPLPQGITSPEYLASLRFHWLHQKAAGHAQIFMLLTIFGANYLWQRQRRGVDFWLCANVAVMILIGSGVAGAFLFPSFNGLNQRVSHLGFYLWMLLVVREIEQRRRLETAAKEQVLTESNSNAKARAEATDILHSLFANR